VSFCEVGLGGWTLSAPHFRPVPKNRVDTNECLRTHELTCHSCSSNLPPFQGDAPALAPADVRASRVACAWRDVDVRSSTHTSEVSFVCLWPRHTGAILHQRTQGDARRVHAQQHASAHGRVERCTCDSAPRRPNRGPSQILKKITRRTSTHARARFNSAKCVGAQAVKGEVQDNVQRTQCRKASTRTWTRTPCRHTAGLGLYYVVRV
jgi:hypothetical protein